MPKNKDLAPIYPGAVQSPKENDFHATDAENRISKDM